MLRSLYPKIDWDRIRAVGFDMDGTLYDEFDFIAQVYLEIATLLAKASGWQVDAIYENMVSRWLEKGSSYPFIFDEAISRIGLSPSKGTLVETCLKTFRSFTPDLHLSPRVEMILNYAKTHHSVFLITDGSAMLQTAKIESLGLYQFFEAENIFISGKHGKNAAKPQLLCLNHIGMIRREGLSPSEIVYFGDRPIDQQFASAANFVFQPVKLMYPVENFKEND